MTQATLQNRNLRQWATYASSSVAFTLIIAKFIAFISTDSVALLSSLLDSTVDLIGSLVTMYGVASAMQPPDHEHRFGHGKAEPLAALAQSAFIAGSGLLLVNEAIGRFFNPTPIQNSAVGYRVMVFSIVLTFGLIRFQRYVIKKTASVAINADHWHYAGDLMVNAAVILSLGIQQFTGVQWVDPLFAIIIAASLLYSAWHIGISALHMLMDHELPNEARAEIQKIVLAQPGVLGLHDLRTRSDSERIFIEIHVEVAPELPLVKAHDVAEDVIKALHAHNPQSDVIVHMDPAGHEEPRLDTQIERKNP